MASLRYVCLSDLHLGAGYSILTPIDEHGNFDQKGGDSVQKEFTKALRAYVGKLSDPNSPPTLILMGDVVDLSFSSTAVSAMAYRRFVQELFPKNEDQVFDDTLLFLPGNHDHHLWRTLQDRHFVKQIEDLVEVQTELEKVTDDVDMSLLKRTLETKVAGKGRIYSDLKSSPLRNFLDQKRIKNKAPWMLRHLIKMADNLKAADTGEIKPLMKVTSLLEKEESPFLESPFLTELLNEATGRKEAPDLPQFSVKTAYPNLGFTNGSKCLVLHHGHFVESMYTAVSHFTAWMSGETSIPDNVADLEAENGGWIDFLWSELGSAGAVGDDTVKMYQILQDPAATREMSTQTASRLAEVLLQRLPASGMPAVRKLTERLTKALLGGALGRYNSSERYAFDSVLSSQSLDTLRWYLNTPVRNQLETELELEEIPKDLDLTFVFGHTHKPFQDLLFLDRYPNPVQLFNTGGWVLDEARLPTTQGAAAVFIDNELNTASLRLFQANPTDEVMSVHVEDARGARSWENPKSGVRDIHSWERDLMNAVVLTNKEWTSFSKAASDSLKLRSKIIFGRFFNPKEHPPVESEAEPEPEPKPEPEPLKASAPGGVS